MHSISILSTLALVGSAFAAPIAEPEVVKVVVTATSVVVVTAGAEPTQPAAPPAAPAAPVDQKVGVQNYGNRRPAKPSVVVVTEVYNAAQPTTKVADSYKPVTTQAPPAPAPPKTTQAPAAPKPSSSYAAVKPAPAPSSSYAAAQPSPAPSTGGSGNYMDVVKTWRAKMGLPELKHDAQLEANAEKTCRDGNGSMKHQLNKGTMGQVLAPGKANDFEHVFVGGWLCEVPTTKGLDGVCKTQSNGWDYAGQTGHNAILVDPKMTKIGCAMVTGIWGCDLGY